MIGIKPVESAKQSLGCLLPYLLLRLCGYDKPFAINYAIYSRIYSIVKTEVCGLEMVALMRQE
jgi:hypothetical protein